MDYIDLHWLPVGAGTRFQRASLLLYESVAAAAGRRPRAALCHAALKIGLDSRTRTLELTPVPRHQPVPPLLSGAVGSSTAGRLRLFRYQLLCTECATLPDEEWTIGEPLRLTTDAGTISLLLETAATIPAYVWGRRAPGTSEMWTSNSAVSWLLVTSGIAAASVALPEGTRAPGWVAGLEEAAHAMTPTPRGQALRDGAGAATPGPSP